MSTKFDASVSVTTAKRRNKEEEEEKKLAKTFAGWVNAQLKPVNVKIEDPIEDLKDGVNLILLLEAVSKKSIEQTMNAKYIRKPSTTIQKVENVSLALKFLSDHIGLKQNVNAEDIVNGNRKILLTLLWRLISSGIAAQPISEEQLKKQKEQEQKEVSATQKMKQAKEKLMTWTREQTAGYKGIELNDFENSFRDGLIFCALVHKYDASFLDYDSLSKDKAVDNLKLAFKIAEEKMNVGSYLEAEDLANPENKIDERSIMTYLSQFPVAFLSQKSSEPSKADNLEKQLEETRQRALQEEQKFKEEKERVDVLHKQKELEKEQLEQQKQQLKQEIAAAESEEDPELWNSHFKLVDDNRKLREDLERLQAIKDSLQKDLISTKKKLIGELRVTVHEGRNLRSSGILGLDSFVTLSYETQQSRTRTVSRRLNPQYNQTFTFYITDASSPLEIVVHSWHLLWKPGFRGKLVIPINFLQAGEQLCKFHKLVHEEGKKQKEYGELRLTLAYKEG